MTATMAKKRADSKRSQKVDRHTRPRLAFHLDAELLQALERFVDDTSPRPTTTSAIITALEAYLTSKGYWPSPPRKEG
jgi:hypothetical protein